MMVPIWSWPVPTTSRCPGSGARSLPTSRRSKIFADLACSSHNAAWERNHLLLFRASLEFLTAGTVNGTSRGW
jgi:hypothetical protein